MRKLTVLALALAMVLGFSVAANAERPLVLRLGHPMAPGNNVTVGYEKFKQLVEEKSHRKIRIQLFPNCQLGSDRVTTEAAQAGTLDLSSSSTPNLASFSKAYMAIDLPYVTSPVHQQALYKALDEGKLGEALREASRKIGLETLMFSEFGYRNFVAASKPLTDAKSLMNLKVRTTDSPVEVAVATELGMNPAPIAWGETYTALQQKTVEGQENPLPAIDAASVQEVQPYCSMWNAIYDCLFFCINGDIYDSMTPEQQEVIDECGRLATQYEREINRAGDDEIMNRWQNENGVTITNYENMDIDSFKQAVDGVDEWYQKELEGQGYDDAKELIETFTK